MATFTLYCFQDRKWIYTSKVTIPKNDTLDNSVKYGGLASFEVRGNHGIIVDRFGVVVATWDKMNGPVKFNTYYGNHY